MKNLNVKKSFKVEELSYKNIILRIYDIAGNEIHFVNFNEKSMGALTTHQQMIDQAVKVGNRHIKDHEFNMRGCLDNKGKLNITSFDLSMD